MGKIDPAFLDDRAILDHPRATTAARRTRPGIFHEVCAAIFLFKRGADTVLQVEQVGFYGLGTGTHEDPLRLTSNG